MDFSLLTQDDKFDFTKYFPAIVDAFTMVGREVEIKKKDKRNFGKVESAFLKDNTDVYDVTFQTEKSIKIKIEVDTRPPSLNIFSEILFYRLSLYISRLQMYSFGLNIHEISRF